MSTDGWLLRGDIFGLGSDKVNFWGLKFGETIGLVFVDCGRIFKIGEVLGVDKTESERGDVSGQEVWDEERMFRVNF